MLLLLLLLPLFLPPFLRWWHWWQQQKAEAAAASMLISYFICLFNLSSLLFCLNSVSEYLVPQIPSPLDVFGRFQAINTFGRPDAQVFGRLLPSFSTFATAVAMAPEPQPRTVSPRPGCSAGSPTTAAAKNAKTN